MIGLATSPGRCQIDEVAV